MINRSQRSAIIISNLVSTLAVQLETSSAKCNEETLPELFRLKKELVDAEENTLIVDAAIHYLRMCDQEINS